MAPVTSCNRRHHCLQTLFFVIQICKKGNKRNFCYKNQCTIGDVSVSNAFKGKVKAMLTIWFKSEE